jgi:N-acetylglucosamine-6-sulfatase
VTRLLHSRIRRWALGAALLLLALRGGGMARAEDANAAVATKPNVVVVETDDWTMRLASQMPNFRSLARRGTTFSNYYASYSLCAPSRATFLTGQYAHNHAVRSNFFAVNGAFKSFRDQGNSLPVWLQHAGYRTAFVGKYLNEYGATDPTLIPPGWNDWHATIDYSTYNYFNWAINENGHVNYHGDANYAKAMIAYAKAGASKQINSAADALGVAKSVYMPFDYFGLARQSDYQPDVVGNIADNALHRLIAPPKTAKTKPFFMWYTPIAAHKESDFERVAGLRPGPVQKDPRPPARYDHSFDSMPPPNDPSTNEADVSDKPANVRDRPLLTQTDFDTIKRNEQGRLGAARAADDAVGKLIATLRKSGKLDNTLFVYTTDQGYLQGQHRIPDNKYFAYEPDIHIPLVMAGPGVAKGKTVSEPVYNQDIAPTIAAAAHARPKRVEDGISLLPALRGGKVAKRDLLLEALEPALPFHIGIPVFDLQAPYYGVRTDRYKYIRWSFGDEELYDLQQDPNELNNLAADPANAQVKATLASEALRLRNCRGSACNTN